MCRTAPPRSAATIAVRLLLLALVAAGGLKAYAFFAAANAGGAGTGVGAGAGAGSQAAAVALPTIAVPVSDDSIEAVARSTGEALKAAKKAVDRWLSWADMGASLRALAYAWLASRYAFLASPGWVYLGE